MFSNSKNIESIGKLLLEFKKYLELQKEFVKLDATEKMTVILSAILIVTVLLLLGSIVLLFLTFALAYYLGDVLGSLSLGFGLISAFILLLLSLIHIFLPQSACKVCASFRCHVSYVRFSHYGRPQWHARLVHQNTRKVFERNR